jgi:hypothetical protein
VRERRRGFGHSTYNDGVIYYSEVHRAVMTNDPYFFGELVCVLYACIFRHVNFQSKKFPLARRYIRGCGTKRGFFIGKENC